MRNRTASGRAALLTTIGLVLAGTGAAPADAQGWIEPGVSRGGFAVDKVRSAVSVRIEGRVAEIEVSEWFRNQGSRLAEGEYLYPLPGEAVFQGFSLFQGDTELRGEIMDADRAREIYEEIVRRRADPALIELAGQGLLRARVFPIQPGETRKVTLRYTQVLERAGNALQLVYAGGVRGGAQRGAGDVVHPVDRADRPRGEGSSAAHAGVESSFEVMADAEAFLDPFSPTHTIDVDRSGDRLSVSIDEAIVGRMALFLPLAGDAVGLSVATHRPVGDDGYFMLTLSPGRERGEVQPRDVTVVMDVSGSMSGGKIEQARQALHQLLNTLSREDRFRLLSFSSTVRPYELDWTEARGRGLDRARAWVDRLVADGGTNIEAALNEAFRLDSPRDRLPVVVFLTDGLPSVGSESPQALAGIAESGAGRARVFAFGVGHDVNTQLLDRLGEAGRGDTDYVEPGENVERVLSLLAAKIQHPVLTDLTLWGGPVEIDEVYPVRIPDVFAGEELVLFGRFDGDGQSQVTVQGERLGRTLDFSTELIFPEASEANAYLPRLWASRKLGHLERQVWTEGMSESLAEEIRTLALRYGLPSRFTSYLVEEPDVVAASGDPVRFGARSSTTLSLDARGLVRAQDSVRAAPRGLGNTITSLDPAARGVASAPTTGAIAVQAAAEARRMRSVQSAGELEAAEAEMMKAAWVGRAGERTDAVAGRVFVEKDGVWTDAGHREGGELVQVVAFSAAWFDLVEALPEIEPILRKHESVVIGGAELSLQIGAEGAHELATEKLAEIVIGFRGAAGR